MTPIIQIKVSLNHTDPLIWRRILIPDSITFFELHHILQIGMGWKNSHLFEFVINDYRIGFIDSDPDVPENMADANLVTVDTLLTKLGFQFKYQYDFGDSWDHTIEVELFLPAEENQQYPFCLEGDQNCPPEDCGGIPGFQNLMSTLKDKRHPDYQEMYIWYGRYNPKRFNLTKVNRDLLKFRNLMKHWKG